MKKWLKVLIITFGVIFIIIAAVLYYSISYIDTTPYFETEYYSNTIEKLNKALHSREKVEGKLQAGFAKINISPKMVKGAEDPSKGVFNNIKLAGFGGGQIATGVHDSIYAKAVALKVDNDLIILVGGDLLLMAPEVVNKVAENLKTSSDLKRKQIYFGATHTHSSIGNCIPGFVGEKFGGKYQPEVVNWLAEKLTTVILKSVSDLQPAQIANGYIHSPNLVKNRIIGKTGRLNDKFTLLSIKQLKGKQTVIGIFAAHATTISDWNSEFSGDYPGYFQRGLERMGVDMAMFYAGTVGSHTNEGKGSKFDRSKYIGEALADSAMIVLNKMEYSDDVNLSTVATEIEIPKLQMIYIADNLRLSPEVGHKLMPVMKPIYLQAFVINKQFSLDCHAL
ncbi:MAG: hypothetical protein GXO85_16440 [Chlorobi bacterium]|nr:hypothetical protein [Chlorobiota bacterium]